MSLVAYAVRTCLWRALHGSTMAGERVYDSAVTAIEDLVNQDPRPFIVISTDDDESEHDGHQLADGTRKLDVVIEIAVGSVANVGTATAPDYALVLASSDDGFEAVVDFLGRQVTRVAQVSQNPFAEIFRALTPGSKKVTRKRGAGTTPRFAARQIVLTCGTVSEPPFGEAPDGEWARLVETMQADEYLQDQAGLLRSHIVGDEIPDWDRLRAALGATRGVLAAAGLGAVLPGEEPAPFAEATIEMEHASLTAVEDDA